MKQDRVAGLGNIAGSESCFWAGIDPRRPVPSLSDAEWEALANGVHHYIESTLDAEDGQELVYLALGGENPFQVYGRAGVCRRCGAEIIRLKQSGRGTWCCSSCQF
jgi:formamidopyrimidine-DNA glycosylase